MIIFVFLLPLIFFISVVKRFVLGAGHDVGEVEDEVEVEVKDEFDEFPFQMFQNHSSLVPTEECIIYWLKYEPNDLLILLRRYSHKFHAKCIRFWLRRGTSRTCPVCRDIVNIWDDTSITSEEEQLDELASVALLGEIEPQIEIHPELLEPQIKVAPEPVQPEIEIVLEPVGLQIKITPEPVRPKIEIVSEPVRLEIETTPELVELDIEVTPELFSSEIEIVSKSVGPNIEMVLELVGKNIEITPEPAGPEMVGPEIEMVSESVGPKIGITLEPVGPEIETTPVLCQNDSAKSDVFVV